MRTNVSFVQRRVVRGGVLLIAFLLSACGSSGTAVPLPTSDWGKPRALAWAETALFTGVLALDQDGCVVARAAGGVGQTLVWPAGYTARTVGDGGVEVLDERGDAVARTGFEVRVGGGWHRPVNVSGACVNPQANAFFVQEHLKPLA